MEDQGGRGEGYERTALVLELPGDGRLGYADLGAGPGGWPVLFFHGWPGCRLQARMAAAAATRLGIRLLAFDRPGLGLSTRAPGRSLGDWPGLVEVAADRLGLGRFDVLGVSGGAPYALACALRLPARVRRVALICGAPPVSGLLANPRLPLGFRLLRLVYVQAPGLLPGLFGLMGWTVRHAPPTLLLGPWARQLGPADAAVLRDPVAARAITRSTVEAFRAGGSGAYDDALVLTRPWGIDLEGVGQTVDLWYGDADPVTPLEVCRTLLGGLPHARWHVLPGEGHYSAPLRHAGAVLETLVRAA